MTRDLDRRRPGRLETLGAWLGVWTPARDVDVPPPPGARALALVAAAVAAVIGVVALVAAPAIDEGKRRAGDAERAAAESRRADRVRRISAEQQPRRGSVPAGEGATAAQRHLERRLLADARRRFDRRTSSTRCRRYLDGRADEPGLRKYQCLAVTSRIDGGRGLLGIPYHARLHLDSGRYVFCKVNPVPGEQVVPDPRRVVELPAACHLDG